MDDRSAIDGGSCVMNEIRVDRSLINSFRPPVRAGMTSCVHVLVLSVLRDQVSGTMAYLVGVVNCSSCFLKLLDI